MDSYPRIHDPAAVAIRQGEDRIQVELADFWDRLDEVGDAQEDIFDRLDVNGWMASVAGEKSMAFDFPDYLRSIPING